MKWQSRHLFTCLSPLLVLVVWCVTLDFPTLPALNNLDSSWQSTLVEARLENWQFGKEILFTYGPWGFLASDFYFPEALVAKLTWELFGKLVLVGLLVGLLAGLPWWRRIAIFGVLCLIGVLFGDTLPMLLITVGVLHLIMHDDLAPWLQALLLIACALLAQIKFTYFLYSLTGLALVGASRAFRGNWRSAALLLTLFVVTFCGFWLLADQNLVRLRNYVRYSWQITTGYPDAMAIEGEPLVVGIAILLLAMNALFLLQLVWSTPREERPKRWVAVLFCSLAWFIAWKHGFTRADGHVLGFFAFNSLCVLIVAGLFQPGSRMRWIDLGAAISLVGAWFGTPDVIRTVPGFFREHLIGNAQTVVTLPTFMSRFATDFERTTKAHELPALRTAVGAGTIDSISLEQSVLQLNRLNHHPRPVFQSYAAYTPALAVKNLRFYQSVSAPEFVLLAYYTIDWRFPGQDDAMLVAELPRRYQPVAVDAGPGRLLLKRRPTAPETIDYARVPLQERAAPFGENVELPDRQSTALWLQVWIPPTLLGRMRATLYQPAQVILVAIEHNGRETKHRLIRRIAEEGFLIQPYLRSAEDMAEFFLGQLRTPIAALRLELSAPGDAKYWKEPVMRFSKIPELPLTTAAQ